MYFSFKEITVLPLYNILTHIANFHLKIAALFNQKLKLGVNGRAKTIALLKANISENEKTIWFHCASLGEYEQGLPVFEKIKTLFPEHKIILSFFSPSGYEIKKNNSIADIVVYLPLDTKQNAKRFLNTLNPELVIFVKYEIWPNYLNELKKRQIRSILISALFRKEQLFFKLYGKWMLNSMSAFEHIFVQNENSKSLLNKHGFNNVTISGDTRFDRVFNQLQIDNTLEFVKAFKQNTICIVAGSTWTEDEKILVNFINTTNNKNVKFIIAPHNIKPHLIDQIQKNLKKPSVLFSKKKDNTIHESKVLILDTIGILSKVYHYADIAYIGGALGNTGLHNTLEAAVFGIPIIIGNTYDKFPEAIDMIVNKGMFSISNEKQLNTTLTELIEDDKKRITSGKRNKDYIKKNLGAVIQIIDFIRK